MLHAFDGCVLHFCVLFHCTNMPQFIFHLPVNGHWGGVQHMAMMNEAAMNIGVDRSACSCWG